MKIKSLLLSISLAVSFLFTAFGYANLTDSLKLEGSANVEKPNYILITNAVVTEGNATVNGYVQTTLSSSVTLETTSSTATITITVYNNSDTTKVFNAVKYSDDAYSNKNITFSLDGIQAGTAVPSYKESDNCFLVFTITFAYVGSDVSNPTLNSMLLFEFADAAEWEPEGGDNTGGDQPGGDGGGTGGGIDDVVVGEDFMLLIQAAMSDVKNSYGLNDQNKGDSLIQAIMRGILYSSDNIQGGNIVHFANETINTHNLDYMFEFSSDTEIFLYMWRLRDLQNVTIGTTEIVVYKQAYHKVGSKWEKSVTLAGHSVVRNKTNNRGDSIIAIEPSEWDIGAPHVTA